MVLLCYVRVKNYMSLSNCNLKSGGYRVYSTVVCLVYTVEMKVNSSIDYCDAKRSIPVITFQGTQHRIHRSTLQRDRQTTYGGSNALCGSKTREMFWEELKMRRRSLADFLLGAISARRCRVDLSAWWRKIGRTSCNVAFGVTGES